jgi:PDZ domain-containing secreted protein
MDGKPRKHRVWIVVLVIVGLVGSFVVGSLVGGVAGFALGRRSAGRMIMQPMWRGMQAPWYMPAPELVEPDTGVALEGAQINSVTDDSPAERAGLQVGDVIVAVEGKAVNAEQTLSDLIGQYEPGDVVTLTVLPVGDLTQEDEVQVTLGRNPDKGGETAWLGIRYADLSGGQD